MSDLTPERRRFLRDVAEEMIDQHRHPFEPSDVLALLDRADDADRLEQLVRLLWPRVQGRRVLPASAPTDLLARVLEGDDRG